MKTFGDLIHEVLDNNKETGIRPETQKQLAEMLGYKSAQVVSDWIRGSSPVPSHKVPDICKILNMNIDDIVERYYPEYKGFLSHDGSIASSGEKLTINEMMHELIEIRPQINKAELKCIRDIYTFLHKLEMFLYEMLLNCDSSCNDYEKKDKAKNNISNMIVILRYKQDKIKHILDLRIQIGDLYEKNVREGSLDRIEFEKVKKLFKEFCEHIEKDEEI